MGEKTPVLPQGALRIAILHQRGFNTLGQAEILLFSLFSPSSSSWANRGTAAGACTPSVSFFFGGEQPQRGSPGRSTRTLTWLPLRSPQSSRLSGHGHPGIHRRGEVKTPFFRTFHPVSHPAEFFFPPPPGSGLAAPGFSASSCARSTWSRSRWRISP